MADCRVDQIKANIGTVALDIKPLKENDNIVGTEYDVLLLVAGDRKPGQKCDDRYTSAANLLTVKVPATTNQPMISSQVNISALNAGLAQTGSALRIDPKLAQEAQTCFSTNLARSIVEMSRRDMGTLSREDKETWETTLGNDAMASHRMVPVVTLSTLDTIAGIIQHGIASCKAGKTR